MGKNVKRYFVTKTRLDKKLFTPRDKKKLDKSSEYYYNWRRRAKMSSNFVSQRPTISSQPHANVCGKFTKKVVDLLLARPRQKFLSSKIFGLFFVFPVKTIFSDFFRWVVPRGTTQTWMRMILTWLSPIR